MKSKLFFLVCALIAVNYLHAQNTFPATGSAGIGIISPAASSALEIKSTTQGLLIPRMTKAQRDAIASPVAGLMVYQTNNTPGFYYYNGAVWTAVSATGANTSLSNLKAVTAVNADILPDTNNTKSLGSSSLSWKDLYATRLDIVSGTENVFGGLHAGALTTGQDNTGFGYNALSLNKNGYNNAAFGEGAMTNNTSGNNNTATGMLTLAFNTTGSANSATGAYALYSNTRGYGNTVSGSHAAFLSATASHIVAIGDSAMYNNKANDNVALGYQSLYTNTSGGYNTAIGFKTMLGNTTGGYNTATGYTALYSNTTGSQNTANGLDVLYYNTTGYNNTATGATTLFKNTIGHDNTASGTGSLYANTTGSGNTAAGADALRANTTGTDNTATGIGSLYANTSGDYNAGYGKNALYSNTTGHENTAIGTYALSDNSSGYYNTAIGTQSFNFNSGGYANTGLGYNTGSKNMNGSYLTLIGFNANAFASSYTNSTGLGNGASINGSNQVRIGNASVTSIGGFANWTNISDGRVKKNIRQNIPGLSFINKLQPVSYNLDLDAIDNMLQPGVEKTKDNSVLFSRSEKEKVIYSGFIAQDVEKAAKEAGFDFSGVDKPTEANGPYGLRYADFVVPLVKAVQELSKQNDQLTIQAGSKDVVINTQQQEISKLQSQMNMVLQKLNDLQAAQQACCNKTGNAQTGTNENEAISVSILDAEMASLKQNGPNPFYNVTVIRYYLPASVHAARLVIADNKGNIIKTIILNNKGNAQVTFTAGSLAAGTYYYSLVADGKKVDTKQMQVIH